MGSSASGKSLIMQAMSGRIQELAISGDVVIDGKRVNPKNVNNPVAYVPQDDCLDGELTARETTRNSACLKRNEDAAVIDAEVQKLLDELGLAHVADGIIGTILFVSDAYFFRLYS